MPGNAPAILAVNIKHFYDDSKTFNLVFWALLVADVDPCLPGQPATSKKGEKGEEKKLHIFSPDAKTSRGPGQRQKEEEAGCEGAFVQAGGTDQEVAMTGQKAGLMGSWKATLGTYNLESANGAT